MTNQPTQEAPSSDVVKAVGLAIDDAWNNKSQSLPPIDLAPDERDLLANAAIAALASTAGDTLKAENERLRALLTPFAMQGFPIPLSVARSHAAGFPDINRAHVQAIRTALWSDQ